MPANWMDHTIASVAPRMAARRVLARQAFETLTRGYDGASKGRRTDGWRAPGSSADTEIGVAGALLRDRMSPQRRKHQRLKLRGGKPPARRGTTRSDKAARDIITKAPIVAIGVAGRQSVASFIVKLGGQRGDGFKARFALLSHVLLFGRCRKACGPLLPLSSCSVLQLCLNRLPCGGMDDRRMLPGMHQRLMPD